MNEKPLQPNFTYVPMSGPQPSDTVFGLVRAERDRAAREMSYLFAEMIFAPSPLLDDLKRTMPPVTWRTRLGWKVRRVRGYFYTIWRALRGDELTDPYDSDDY